MAEMTVVLNENQQVELTNFIEKVGGLDNASGILGITKKTLIEYTSNSETHISKKVLNEKILPVINDTTEQLYGLLIKRNKEIENEYKEYRQKYFSCLTDTSIIRDKNKFFEIANNPVFLYMSLHDYEKTKLYGLTNLLTEFIEKKTCDKYKLVHEMTEFYFMYDLFKPAKITKNDYYWGTVKLIDKIFYNIYASFDVYPVTRFYNLDDFTDALWQKDRGRKVEWSLLLSDLEVVRNAIENTMYFESSKLLCLTDGDLTGDLHCVIFDLIKMYIPYIQYSDIEIINGHDIIIKDKEIQFNNGNDFLYNLKEYSSTLS